MDRDDRRRESSRERAPRLTFNKSLTDFCREEAEQAERQRKRRAQPSAPQQPAPHPQQHGAGSTRSSFRPPTLYPSPREPGAASHASVLVYGCPIHGVGTHQLDQCEYLWSLAAAFQLERREGDPAMPWWSKPQRR